MSRFSQDLDDAANGDAEAKRRLWADHYDTLLECAVQWFRRRWDAKDGAAAHISLCATDLVNEVFLRLVDRSAAVGHGRQFFFRVFYNECLRVAVDHFRKTRRHRGRGGQRRVELESRFLADNRAEANLDQLVEIIDELERNDARMGQIARIKVFDHRPDDDRPGTMRALTNAEIGELLGVATRTVEGDWKFAKAFLLHRLGVQDDG